MTEKETVNRIVEMTSTLAAFDLIVQRFGPSMVENELAAIETAYRLIDQMRAEEMIETGAFAVEDFVQPAADAVEPEEPEPEPEAADPVLEKARVALKSKPQKK